METLEALHKNKDKKERKEADKKKVHYVLLVSHELFLHYTISHFHKYTYRLTSRCILGVKDREEHYKESIPCPP